MLLITAITAAIIGYQIYDRFCWFGIEDQVVHSFHNVVDSVKSYINTNQKVPESLDFINPDVMLDVQQMKEIVSTEYFVIPERKAWKLDVHVRARGKERQFIYVSDGKLTPEEDARYYVGCHDWVVLKYKE